MLGETVRFINASTITLVSLDARGGGCFNIMNTLGHYVAKYLANGWLVRFLSYGRTAPRDTLVGCSRLDMSVFDPL